MTRPGLAGWRGPVNTHSFSIILLAMTGLAKAIDTSFHYIVHLPLWLCPVTGEGRQERRLITSASKTGLMIPKIIMTNSLPRNREGEPWLRLLVLVR
jgi:hypothetical protein